MRIAACCLVLLSAIAAYNVTTPSCNPKPNKACSSLKWASSHNMTCCLVPDPPSWMSTTELEHCMGFGLGCPAEWGEWEAHGTRPDEDDCYCDKGAGECASGTIDAMLTECGC